MTVNDLMTQAAEALDNRDLATLERLQGVANEWMQDNESIAAQNAMLEAMIAAVEAIIKAETTLDDMIAAE